MADADDYRSKEQRAVDERGYYNEADIARIKREDPKARKNFADIEKERAAKRAAARKKQAAKRK
jgi:hypothetical protein